MSGLTWAVLGLGLAGMAGGTAFGLMTAGAVDDFNAAKLRSEAENAKVRAESRSLYANIGFLVGGLALTGGAALLTVNLLSGGGGQAAATAGGSGGELSSSSAGWSLRPKLGPDGAGLVLHQEF
ncbi:MAG: hypothetical protein FJ125_13630 [Deltaproteobacteria bacterium]|nr:hypothetical protein [Deltaproteobacteria bacterium]